MYRPEWFPSNPYHGEPDNHMASVFDLCSTLHEAKIGSSEGLPKDEEQLYLKALKWVLDNWTQSRNAYEVAVHMLIVETVAEYA